METGAGRAAKPVTSPRPHYRGNHRQWSGKLTRISCRKENRDFSSRWETWAQPAGRGASYHPRESDLALTGHTTYCVVRHVNSMAYIFYINFIAQLCFILRFSVQPLIRQDLSNLYSNHPLSSNMQRTYPVCCSAVLAVSVGNLRRNPFTAYIV